MTIDSGSPSELAGLLVVNPEEGNERPDAGSGDTTPPEENGGAGKEAVDWNDDAAGEHDNADDTATGADDAADDQDGSAETEGEGEQQTEADTMVEVVIGGETKQVPLKEALAGYQRQEDYTRKTQEVAAAREALAAEAEAVRAHRASYKSVLDALEAKIGPANQEPTAEQWDALKNSDPDRYAVEWADYQRRAEQRKHIDTERQRVLTEEAAEHRKVLQTYVDGERAKLVAAMPQWKGKDGKIDAEKFTKEIEDIRAYATKAFNYSKDELDRAYDHRLIVAFRKAMLFDRAEAARVAAKGKLAAAPDMPAPGSRVPHKNASQTAKKEAQKKFEKTGKVEDGVALLLS
jgi:hypothetical protein